MKRGRPLRRQSDKAKAREHELAIAREGVRQRSGGWCEVSTPACRSGAHYGAHAHHVKRRSQGGGHTTDNLLWLCFDGHDWIHAHPADARERGWLG